MHQLKKYQLLTIFLIILGASSAYAQDTASNQAAPQTSPFSHIPRGVPVVMLNILRFSAQAHYDIKEKNTITGRQAYDIYREGASKLVAKTGGKRLWIGDVKAALIAPADEPWDEVFLVQYPSVEAFLKMVNSSEYKAVAIHRTAALDDSRLIAMIEQQ